MKNYCDVFSLQEQPNEYSDNIVQYDWSAVFSSLMWSHGVEPAQGREFKLNSTLLDHGSYSTALGLKH